MALTKGKEMGKELRQAIKDGLRKEDGTLTEEGKKRLKEMCEGFKKDKETKNPSEES